MHLNLSLMMRRGAVRWLRTLISSLPSSMSFTRASSVTVPDNLGVLQTVGNNVPAFEGLRLSYLLSDGATLGPELLTTAQKQCDSGWGFGDGTVTTDGKLRFTASTSYARVINILTEGKRYSTSVIVESISGGTLNIGPGNGTGYIVVSIPGTYSFPATATALIHLYVTVASGTVTAVLDTISEREITPVWLTTAIDGITPLTSQGMLNEPGATNLLLQSDDISNNRATGIFIISSFGGASAITRTNNTTDTLDVNGGNTAAKFVFPAVTVANSVAVVGTNLLPTTVAGPCTFSVFMRGAVGGEQLDVIWTPDGVTFIRNRVTLDTSWKRYSVSGVSTAGSQYLQVGGDRRSGGASTSAQTVYMSGVWQMENNAFATSTIPTTTVAVTRAASVATITSPALPATVTQLGPELNASGNFTGWTTDGESTISSGIGRIYSSAGATSALYAWITTPGRYYQYLYNITGTPAGNMLIDGVVIPKVVGMNTVTVMAAGAGAQFTRSDGITDIYMNTVSVKEVLGMSPWIAEVKFRSKVNSAQITTPMAVGGSWFDANNYVKLRVNSVIAYLEVNKAGVKEYVTIPCTLVAGLNYSFLVRRNADGTFDLFLNQVKSLSGLGAELIANANLTSATGWTVQAGWTFTNPGFAFNASVLGGIYQSSLLTIGKIYTSTITQVKTSGNTRVFLGDTWGVLNSNTFTAVASNTYGGVNAADSSVATITAVSNLSTKQVYNSTTATQPVHGALWSVGNDGQGGNQFFGSIVSAGAKPGMFTDAQCLALNL